MTKKLSLNKKQNKALKYLMLKHYQKNGIFNKDNFDNMKIETKIFNSDATSKFGINYNAPKNYYYNIEVIANVKGRFQMDSALNFHTILNQINKIIVNKEYKNFPTKKQNVRFILKDYFKNNLEEQEYFNWMVEQGITEFNNYKDWVKDSIKALMDVILESDADLLITMPKEVIAALNRAAK